MDHLATQIRTSRTLGIREIFTKVTRGEVYHLALLGYDAQLRAIIPHETSGQVLPATLSRYQTVQELMGSPAGRAWWQRFGGTPGMTFDPTPGSPSMHAFNRYRRGAS